jgi:uncharacterized membrane protein HdeD (DUF308 family)
MTIEPRDPANAAANEPDDAFGIDREKLVSAMGRSLKAHWRLYTVQGVLLVILGTIAVAVPRFAAVAATDFIGWLLFFTGIMQAVSIVSATHAPGYWSSLLLAVLTAILGFVLAWYPLQGAITLTMLLTAYFLVHGIATFIFAFSVKGETGRWVLLLLSGLVDLLLAGLVIAEWPSTDLWVLGLFIGVNMMLTGFAIIFAALGARSAGGPPALA